MPLFAVVFNDSVVAIREYPEQPECKMVDGLPTVRPFIDAEETVDKKHDGFVIEADKVTRKLSTRTVPEAREYLQRQIPVAKAKHYKVPREVALEQAIASAGSLAALKAIDLNSGW